VIGVIPGQIVTESLAMTPTTENGLAVADPARDLLTICVAERHHATGQLGKGFVTGFGLKRGAIASTIAHDAHNLIAVGCSDADIVACIERLGEIGGGLVVVADGQVLDELALPIAGLLSDRPASEVIARLDHLHTLVASLGGKLEAPFMALSFLALSVIPALKITDRGLVDVERFALVPLQT